MTQTKDTWQAGNETDVLLAKLRGDTPGVLDALHRMDVHELAVFGQHLYALQGAVAEVATAKARKLAP